MATFPFLGLVTVSNIGTQTVEFSGTQSDLGANLTLVAAPPVTATSVINFEMNAAAPEAALTLTELTVAAGLKAVDIDSTGLATANVITDVGSIADNITVTGGTPLTLGSAGAPIPSRLVLSTPAGRRQGAV